MRLGKALGTKKCETIAFVGAGGKTSAMFSLAREMDQAVVLTTTTHLGAWQAGLADEHVVMENSNDLKFLKLNENKIVLITGPADEDERLGALDSASLGDLKSRCKRDQIMMLIEADGARHRNLKAPAAYEPVIPGWVDCVVVVAGLGGLDKPLGSETVHRPEIFSNLSHRPMGEQIGVDDLVSVLGSEMGGLKGMPASARRMLFLNQAEGHPLQAKGGRIARELQGVFDRVLIGSLHEPAQTGPIFSVHAPTAGVILAAGGSRRLGRPKQLLEWEGKPFIVRVAQNALAAGLKPLVVVTGADHPQIASALEGFQVNLVHNENWPDGQSTSMRAGLEALPERIDSALFMLSDQPQIPPTLIHQLIESYSANRKAITAPLAGGERGNPVLFAGETFPALRAVSGDKGGRAVFSKFNVDWLPWIDDRILMDVDTQEDLERLQEAFFPG